MRVVRGTEAEIRQIAEALDIILELPRDQEHRGSRCPPPPFGRIGRHIEAFDTGDDFALPVTERVTMYRGQMVELSDGTPYTVPAGLMVHDENPAGWSRRPLPDARPVDVGPGRETPGAGAGGGRP